MEGREGGDSAVSADERLNSVEAPGSGRRLANNGVVLIEREGPAWTEIVWDEVR